MNPSRSRSTASTAWRARPRSDDTAATAHDLGDVTGAGLVQVAGAIGDDPSFNPSLSPTRPTPSRNSSPPTRWTSITSRSPGPGSTRCSPRSSRAGSARRWTPASACSSSIRATASSSSSPATTTRSTPPRAPTGRSPCSPTPALTAGLTAGDYYLAVADGSNTPSPLEGQMPGSPGIFDPNQPGSAQNGWSTGPYRPEPPGPAGPESAPGRGLVAVPRPGPRPGPHADHRAILGAGQYPAARLPGVRDDRTRRRFPRSSSRGPTGRRTTRDSCLTTARRTGHVPDARRPAEWLVRPAPLGTGRSDRPRRQPAGRQRPERRLRHPLLGPGARPRHLGQHDRRLHGSISQAGQGVPQDLGVLFPDELQAGVTIIRGTPSPAPSPALLDAGRIRDPAPPEPVVFVHS